MATRALHDITSADTRLHPYSIAASYETSPTYETHGGDTRPSFTNSPAPAPAPASAPAPPLSSSRTMPPHLAVRIISANQARPRKPLWRLPTTHSFRCMSSPHTNDDHYQLIADAQVIEPARDVDDYNSRQSFFDGMSKVDSRKTLKHTRSKRTRFMADTSPKPARSWSASIRDYLTQSPTVEPLQNEKPYHYQKRSARSFQNSAMRERTPDEQSFEVTKRRAGALDIAIRAIESASYIPDGVITLDGSSGSSCLPALDDLDSVSSGSIYSPTHSPAPPVHRALLSTEDMDDDMEQRLPQEDVFKQRLLQRSVAFDNNELHTTPLTPRRLQTVSFSRPTPQVYPYLICQASATQDSSQQAPHQSHTNHIRIKVPSETSPAPHFTPLSPSALPNRNPKRTPSDSGHGSLIHTTLDLLFPEEGQDKADMFTPGPSTVVVKQPALPPPSWRQKPLTSIGKRF